MNIYILLLIFIILFIIITINKDFKKSKGFLKQKILYSICLFILFFFCNHSVKLLLFIFNYKHFALFYNKYFIQVWIFPPAITLTINFISIFLGSILFIFAWVLQARNESIRNIIVKIIPLYIITEIPSYYLYYIQQPTELAKSIYFILGSIYILIFLSISILYRSKFMRVFFDEKKKQISTPPQLGKTLEEVS
jgi:hypothetical protein